MLPGLGRHAREQTGNAMDDCIFCKIVRGEIPSKRIAETQHALAFDDINPLTPVHTLIIPKKHLHALSAATIEDSEVLSHCLLLAVEVAAIKGVTESGYRLITNDGPRQRSGRIPFAFSFAGRHAPDARYQLDGDNQDPTRSRP